MATAYLATRFNNIMDMLQLVFAFVNAPLFATFLLGMFWKRATGHGAFFGLVLRDAGGGAASWPDAADGRRSRGSRADGSALLHTYPSEMAQNFWTAIWAWTACFVMTILISLATPRTKTDAELTGLVYSLTPRPVDTERAWIRRPEGMGAVVLALVVVLNIIFW